MSNRILLVVGDKFAAYARGKDVITLSNLRGLLTLSIPLLSHQGRTVLVPGQGLNVEAVKQLLEEASRSPNLSHFDFSLWHDLPEKAPASLTHKHRPENVLVSVPTRMNANQFQMHLMVDEDCELMHDHLSGQHVQGMVLIEAARQGMLAIAEAYLIPDNGIDYAFVFEALSVQYSHYTFPLGAVIETNIVECATDNPKRLHFAAETFVRQCGQTVSEFTMSFSAMERSRISRSEGIMATKTQAHFMREVATNLENQELAVQKVENL